MSITKSELAGLLKEISHYQRSGAGNIAALLRRAVNSGYEHEDLTIAQKLNSPLVTFFTTLILIKEMPDKLEQRHLDILHRKLQNDRSLSFHEMHLNGGENIIEKLQKAGLLFDVPETSSSDNKFHGYSKYKLNSSLLHLAETPLDEVKKMLEEINESKVGGINSRSGDEDPSTNFGRLRAGDILRSAALGYQKEKTPENRPIQNDALAQEQARRLEEISRRWREQELAIEELLFIKRELEEKQRERQKEKEEAELKVHNRSRGRSGSRGYDMER